VDVLTPQDLFSMGSLPLWSPVIECGWNINQRGLFFGRQRLRLLHLACKKFYLVRWCLITRPSWTTGKDRIQIIPLFSNPWLSVGASRSISFSRDSGLVLVRATYTSALGEPVSIAMRCIGATSTFP
jgi:hypothetical protein